MPKFVVEGGHRLQGTVRPAGNKNAALPMLAATLLTEDEIILENVPDIRDVRTMVGLLQAVGAEAEWIGANEVRVRAKEVGGERINAQEATRIRASILIAGPMVWVTSKSSITSVGGRELGLALVAALVGGVTASSLYIYGVERIPAARAGILAYLEPVSASLIGAVVFHGSVKRAKYQDESTNVSIVSVSRRAGLPHFGQSACFHVG